MKRHNNMVLFQIDVVLVIKKIKTSKLCIKKSLQITIKDFCKINLPVNHPQQPN